MAVTQKSGQAPKIDDLVSYLTFALTVSSLGLALLAIIYSVFSNTTFAQNISLLQNTTKSLDSTSSKLAQSTDELGKKLDAVPQVIKTVGDKVEETHKLIKGMSPEARQVKNAGIKISEKNLDSVYIDEFLSNSSFAGLLNIYMHYLSDKTGKPFNLNELSEKTYLTKFDYMYGYSVATASMGLIQYTTKEEFTNAIAVNERVKERIYDTLKIKVDEISIDDQDFREKLMKDIETVREYFDSE